MHIAVPFGTTVQSTMKGRVNFSGSFTNDSDFFAIFITCPEDGREGGGGRVASPPPILNHTMLTGSEIRYDIANASRVYILFRLPTPVFGFGRAREIWK